MPVFEPDAQMTRLDLTQQIKIVIMDTDGDFVNKATAAIDSAVAAWNTALAPYGLNINTTYSNQTCTTAESGHCVQVHRQNPPDNPTACAGTLAPPNSIANVYVSINGDTWSDLVRAVALTHEFGHLFDLLDQKDVCTNGVGSIMNEPQGTCTNLTSIPTTPTVSDALAVGQGTYGNTPLHFCR
jgi:hypothetical protein